MNHNWKPPTLSQATDHYRYSLDAWLLAGFAKRYAGSFFLDIGTGCGVVAYGLCQHGDTAGIAIERNRVLVRHAQTNLNNLPVTIVAGDVRSFPWRHRVFDLVVSNPPYYEVGSGRVNKNAAIAEARHTYHGGILDFAGIGERALGPNGAFCFVFPSNLIHKPLSKLLKAGWYLWERLDVRSFEDRTPRLVCLCLKRLAPVEMESRVLTIYREHRVYTDDAISLLGKFDS